MSQCVDGVLDTTMDSRRNLHFSQDSAGIHEQEISRRGSDNTARYVYISQSTQRGPASVQAPTDEDVVEIPPVPARSRLPPHGRKVIRPATAQDRTYDEDIEISVPERSRISHHDGNVTRPASAQDRTDDEDEDVEITVPERSRISHHEGNVTRPASAQDRTDGEDEDVEITVPERSRISHHEGNVTRPASAQDRTDDEDEDVEIPVPERSRISPNGRKGKRLASAQDNTGDDDDDDEMPKQKRPRSLPRQKTTLWSLLMELPPIPLQCADRMLYDVEKESKHDSAFKQNILMMIMAMRIFQDHNKSGNEFLQFCLQNYTIDVLYKCELNSKLKKTLKSWLKKYATYAKYPTSRETSAEMSPLLPEPSGIRASPANNRPAQDNSTPWLPRDDTNNQHHHHHHHHRNKVYYRRKCVPELNSMYWETGDGRKYTLRSQENDGSFIVKLEIYSLDRVLNKNTDEWYKHCDLKHFVMVQENSPQMEQVARLHNDLKRMMEGYDDVVAEYSV